jgi:Fic family protein
LTKTSMPTALRDINDLIDKGVLKPNPGGGRSASYDLVRTS